MGVLIAYLTLFYFFVRETRGLTVEEAATVYESEDGKQLVMEEERRVAELLARTVAGESEQRDEKEQVSGEVQHLSKA